MNRVALAYRRLPFNTGNDTFGLSSQSKRYATIAGDLDFLSQRRVWSENAAGAQYVYASPTDFFLGFPTDTSASAILISQVMIDCWVSFVTTLTPNDDLGIPRPEWTQFTPQNKAVMQLNGANLTMIPDDFHAGN
ncbi:hypothetical protein C8R44DRAFT_883252 [Mycena epipterygia]|nr:hypothetical protein C8R44DRAFT_883252 [Mycena epipterygia]